MVDTGWKGLRLVSRVSGFVGVGAEEGGEAVMEPEELLAKTEGEMVSRAWMQLLRCESSLVETWTSRSTVGPAMNLDTSWAQWA